MSIAIPSTSLHPQSLSSIPPSSTTDSSSETNSNNNTHYNHVSVFDKFNISSLIKNDLLIPKTSKQTFLYKRELEQKQKLPLKSAIPSQQQTDPSQVVINEINKNHFDIKIDKLIIHYPNDLDINFMSVYTPIKYIGEGAFGLVIAVIKNETKEHYAVKIIKKNYNLFSNTTYLNEVSLLKKLKHPRILHLHEVLDTNEYLFLFTDHIQGGSLKDFIMTRYSNNNDNNDNNNYFIKDSECATIIRSLLEAVAYLHRNNIMHRDLKPENIMFKNKDDLNSLVICDFGIAGEIATFEFTKSKCGTLLYMAPEILKNRPYDFLVDLWSVGIILYILESGGKHPIFVQGIEKKMFIKETKTKKEWEFPLYFPNIARNLFMKLCKSDSFFRYRTDKALKHPWITRQINKEIPLTLVEVFEKEDKVKRFKNMLLSGTMILLLYKDIEKQKEIYLKENEDHNNKNNNNNKPLKSSSFLKRNIIKTVNDSRNISLTNLSYATFRIYRNINTKQSFIDIRDKIHNNKEYESKFYLTNISQINNNNNNNEHKYPCDINVNGNTNTQNNHHLKYKTQSYKNNIYIKKTNTHTHMSDLLLTRENAYYSTKGFNLKALHLQSCNIQKRKVTYFPKQTKDRIDALGRNNSNKQMLLKVNKSPVKLMSFRNRLINMDDYIIHSEKKKVSSSRVVMLKEIKIGKDKDNKEKIAQMKCKEICKTNRINHSKDIQQRVKTSRIPRRSLMKSCYGFIKKEFD